MGYRKPTVYIPPYNYCDRWCDGCAVDKARCLLYQTEMDERLHREIDGLGELPREAEPSAPRPKSDDPIVEEATLAARAVAAFVREHGGGHPRESQQLRRS